MYYSAICHPFLGALDDICQVLSANLPQALGMNIIQQEFETTDRAMDWSWAFHSISPDRIR